MSIGSAAAAAIGGQWDVFDRVTGIIEGLMNRLQSLDPEDADSLLDFSMNGRELEVSGGSDELLEALATAKAAFEEICTLCQHAEAALPE